VGNVLTVGATVKAAVGAAVGRAEGLVVGTAVGTAGHKPVKGHVELTPYAIPEQEPNNFITHVRPPRQQAS
jgi:hypothetical protein